MRIKKGVVAVGYGGFFWDDQAAIKGGLEKDGFIYEGFPVTSGFETIRMPSECLSVLLVLEDGQIAHGDCVSVQYSGAAGRDPLFKSAQYLPFFKGKVLPMIEGKEITQFREMSEEFDSTTFEGRRLHTAIRYGVTQAFLDAVAKSQRKTMAEVIAEEYAIPLSLVPVPIFIQTGDDLYESIDKCILRKVEVFPHYLINNLKKLSELPEQLKFTKKRIKQLAGDAYSPYLHYDLYGIMGVKYRGEIPEIIKELESWSKLVSPYKLIIEAPFIMKTQEETIELTRELIRQKNRQGLDLIICVDEWCNTLEDVKRFIDALGAEMIQIKTPDMGGLNQTVAAIRYCQQGGLKAYLGGSSCETERSAQITAHIGLATRPFQMLAKPGMGIDEGYQIIVNEMMRTIALITQR